MSQRSRDVVVALKIEATPGTYDAPSSSTDVLPITEASLSPEVDLIADGRRVGGLDEGDSTVGRVIPAGSIVTELLGDIATPACPAVLKRLFQIAGWAFTTTTVIPSTGVADVTAGGVNTCTVDRSTFTTFPATTGALVGMEAELSGVPATTERRTILTYVVTGNNCVITFAPAPSVTLTTSTKIKILANDIARPHSGVIPTASMDHYLDTRKTSFRGLVADLSMQWSAGQRATVSAQVRGAYQGNRSDVTQPTPTPLSTLAPVWRGGRMRLGGLAIAVNTMGIQMGNTLGTYGDPEDAEGFTAHEITRRGMRVTLDPKSRAQATADAIADLRAGTERTILAQIGSTVGNRITFLGLRGKPISVADKDTEGLAGEEQGFKLEGRDASIGSICWS